MGVAASQGRGLRPGLPAPVRTRSCTTPAVHRWGRGRCSSSQPYWRNAACSGRARRSSSATCPVGTGDLGCIRSGVARFGRKGIVVVVETRRRSEVTVVRQPVYGSRVRRTLQDVFRFPRTELTPHLLGQRRVLRGHEPLEAGDEVELVRRREVPAWIVGHVVRLVLDAERLDGYPVRLVRMDEVNEVLGVLVAEIDRRGGAIPEQATISIQVPHVLVALHPRRRTIRVRGKWRGDPATYARACFKTGMMWETSPFGEPVRDRLMSNVSRRGRTVRVPGPWHHGEVQRPTMTRSQLTPIPAFGSKN